MRWLSRKFLLSSATMLVGAYLSHAGKLDMTTATFLGTVLTAYLGSNVGQKVVVPQ